MGLLLNDEFLDFMLFCDLSEAYRNEAYRSEAYRNEAYEKYNYNFRRSRKPVIWDDYDGHDEYGEEEYVGNEESIEDPESVGNDYWGNDFEQEYYDDWDD